MKRLQLMVLCALVSHPGLVVLSQVPNAKAPMAADHWKELQIAFRERWQLGKITRVFGLPTWRHSPSKGALTVGFRNRSDEIETLVFELKNSRLESIEVYPVLMSLEEAVKLFGTQFSKQRYTFDDCLSDGESAPVFRDPKGQLVYYEYPALSMYLSIDEKSQLVRFAVFSRDPIGTKRSNCVP